MKAPDKIYVHRTVHLGLLSASEIDITGSDEQYIRKDALLEWLDKNIKGLNVLFGEIFIAKVKDKLKQL